MRFVICIIESSTLENKDHGTEQEIESASDVTEG